MTVRNRVLTLVVLASILGALSVVAAHGDTVVVEMTSVDFVPTFVPSEVTIQPGDTVRWVNVDPFLRDHSTCSGTGIADPFAGELWNSGTLQINDSFEYTFEEVGEFAYFSVPHEYEGMFGLVIVSSSSSANQGIRYDTWGKVKNLFRDVLPK
jgi:plastocyanin